MSEPTDTPKRLHLQRTKGWRKPHDAVVVARPSRWGNPFSVAEARAHGFVAEDCTDADARRFVVACFEDWLLNAESSPWWFAAGAERHARLIESLPALRGKDLCCWCPDSDPCHGDVLLKAANK